MRKGLFLLIGVLLTTIALIITYIALKDTFKERTVQYNGDRPRSLSDIPPQNFVSDSKDKFSSDNGETLSLNGIGYAAEAYTVELITPDISDEIINNSYSNSAVENIVIPEVVYHEVIEVEPSMISSYLPDFNENRFYILKFFDNRLALFNSLDTVNPILIFDIPFYSFPEMDRIIFNDGVAIHNKEEYLMTLEDFVR